MTGTCSKDIRVSTCGMQTFTRFYGNIVYCGLISDFSTSLWFLFNEDDFAISNSMISARAYEISPSVGPLGEDKYYVVSKQSVTAKKFLATCNYLANYNDYPVCCDRIIIYFVGHGRDGYIKLDIDYSDMQKEKDSKKLKRREDNERFEESKIDIEHVLSIFRHHTIKEKMSIILLLDACCNAKSVECEEHELVASAASKTASKKFGAKSDHSGGYWTNTLFYVLNKTDEKYDIIKLLKEA